MRENRAGSAYQKRKTTRQNELDPGLESHSGCARGVGVTARNSSTRLQRSDVDRGASLRPGKPYASAYRRQVRNSSDWIAADTQFCWTSCVSGTCTSVSSICAPFVSKNGGWARPRLPPRSLLSID